MTTDAEMKAQLAKNMEGQTRNTDGSGRPIPPPTPEKAKKSDPKKPIDGSSAGEPTGIISGDTAVTPPFTVADEVLKKLFHCNRDGVPEPWNDIRFPPVQKGDMVAWYSPGTGSGGGQNAYEVAFVAKVNMGTVCLLGIAKGSTLLDPRGEAVSHISVKDVSRERDSLYGRWDWLPREKDYRERTIRIEKTLAELEN